MNTQDLLPYMVISVLLLTTVYSSFGNKLVRIESYEEIKISRSYESL